MIIHTIRDRGSIWEAQEEKALGRKEGRKEGEKAPRERSSMIFISLGQADTMLRYDVLYVCSV